MLNVDGGCNNGKNQTCIENLVQYLLHLTQLLDCHYNWKVIYKLCKSSFINGSKTRPMKVNYKAKLDRNETSMLKETSYPSVQYQEFNSLCLELNLW